MNITQLHEQHKNIEVTLNDIDQLISKNDFTQLAGEIARKINQDVEGFLKEYKATIEALKKRLDKEETELYRIAETL